MDPFFAGLLTWWATKSASAFYTGIGGRLRNNVARQNEVKPYAVFTQIDGLPEYFQDGDYDELFEIELQLDIYGATNLSVSDLSTKAMAIFDGAAITVTGWTLLDFTRFRNTLMGIEDVEDVDNPVYRYLMQYKAILQKVRT